MESPKGTKHTDSAEWTDKKSLRERYDTFAEEHPYAATIGETAVLFALRYGLEKAGDKVGLPLGHGRKDSISKRKLIERHPYLATAAATIWAPASEEMVFREAPARVLDRKGFDSESLTSKRTKLAVAAIFAAAHGGPDAVPLPQFVGGLNYGRIHEKRGLKAAVLAHSLNNTLAAAQYLAGQRKR
jgi:hypothetical protein